MTNEINPLDHKTAAGYLEYILQSEGELLWMHFDEAQRIESQGKDQAFDEGMQAGIREAHNITFGTTTTTSTTFLCTKFIPDGFNSPNQKCMRCGKESWQHDKITNTLITTNDE